MRGRSAFVDARKDGDGKDDGRAEDREKEHWE